jgi:hypothetical protein
MIAVDTHIQIKRWIYLLSNWRDENRVEYSLEVVRQQNECTSMLPIQDPEYIVLDPIWPSVYTILVYNIQVCKTDVIVPFLQYCFTFILHDKKRENEKAHK